MGRNRLFTDEQFKTAFEAANFDTFKTAQMLECTQATVYIHLARLGIDVTKVKYTKSKENQMPIFNAWKGQQTIPALAEQFNISRSFAYRMLRGAIELYWNTEAPPVWPAPGNVPEIKVFHCFNDGGWDKSDQEIATECNIQIRHVAAYRTRCHTLPTARPENIIQNISRRTAQSRDGGTPAQKIKAKQYHEHLQGKYSVTPVVKQAESIIPARSKAKSI